MRRAILCGASVLVAVLVLAPGALAARILTWTINSRYVDPAGPTPFNRPPGVKTRRNLLRVDIYLPAGYDGHRRFPVLWLLHGHGDAYDSWLNPQQGDFLHVARGFNGIVVMPEAAQGWYTDWWSAGSRRPGWESYVLLELMPRVQRRLRILPGRANHAVAGLSMGGEGAAYLAEQRPGYFGAVATFSGSLSIQRPEWPTGFGTQGQDYNTVFGPKDGFYATGHNPVALAGNLAHTRVFVRVGNGAPRPSEVGNGFGIAAETELQFHAMDFFNAARAAGARAKFEQHRGIHAWYYWRRDLAAALGWGLFAPVAERPLTWSYETVDQHAQAWDLRLDFASPPAALERFIRTGDRLTGMGAGAVVITTAGGCRVPETLPFAVKLPVRRCAGGASR